MAIASNQSATVQRQLRLWPGVLIVALQWGIRFGLPAVVPDLLYVGAIGGVAGGLAVVLWWLFFSRARWLDRLGGLVLMAAVPFATYYLLHRSIATGMMGMMFGIYLIPVLSLAFVTWAAVTRNLPDTRRRLGMVIALLLACLPWTLLRTGGMTGDADSDFHWRWTETPEERLLSSGSDLPAALPSAPPTVTETPEAQPSTQPENVMLATTPDQPQTEPDTVASQTQSLPAPEPSVKKATMERDWPGFRGPERNSVIRGMRIRTDWSTSPPVEMWRRPIGPGWSSFAVRGDLFYTQEQRGEEEIVSCYRLATGEPVWSHSDTARFWESNAGPGPRGTPTLGSGRVYTLGATGILNALNADDGTVVWTRNAATDTSTEVPGWGFASSPLVLGDSVIVATSGSMAAYKVDTGDLIWRGPTGRQSYSSPHLFSIAGVPQILLLSSGSATSVAPADGAVLWNYAWTSDVPIVQPAANEGDLLIGTGEGIRRVSIAHGGSGWKVEDRWKSIGLKPYFNDFVVHNDHAYGFDGSYLSCIDLKDGKRTWKGGRYGHGQLILLADQDLLVVISEQGELALVDAVPGAFTERARVAAIHGKTWNHPVLAGDVLLARNGEEMAAFRLALLRR